MSLCSDCDVTHPKKGTTENDRQKTKLQVNNTVKATRCGLVSSGRISSKVKSTMECWFVRARERIRMICLSCDVGVLGAK